MASFSILMISILICPYIGLVSSNETLTLDPRKSKTYVLKGALLTLKCVYESSKKNTSHPNFFYFSNYSLTGEGIQIENNVTEVNETSRITITLTKNVTDEDAGTYKCSLGNQTDTTDVYIFEVSGTGSYLPRDQSQNVTLKCNLKADVDIGSYIIQWKYGYLDASKGTKDLVVDKSKYDIPDIGSLVIHNPARSDIGEYLCVYTFFGLDKNETFIPKPVELKAGPRVDTIDEKKKIVQGENVDINCEVSGFPIPRVEWRKDGITLNASQRVHFSQDGKYSVKIYSLDFSDDGMYACYAENLVDPFNDTKSMRLRVKDKLAALWPFLGIVAEVIILCAIILIYEKRRSKMLADKNDVPDSNPDNTVDHKDKDVRHRTP